MNNEADNNESDADAEYLLGMELFEIEQAFLDAMFDDDGNEVVE